ncbi:MAG: HypC/HybG/HupF family hydrogenase formation chaperone [Chloroflexota bacterium]
MYGVGAAREPPENAEVRSMCLGIPGQIVEIEANDQGLRMGTISYGGLTKEVSLVFVPDAQVGEYVIIHAGFAISKIDEHEANETLALLKEMADLGAAEATG